MKEIRLLLLCLIVIGLVSCQEDELVLNEIEEEDNEAAPEDQTESYID